MLNIWNSGQILRIDPVSGYPQAPFGRLRVTFYIGLAEPVDASVGNIRQAPFYTGQAEPVEASVGNTFLESVGILLDKLMGKPFHTGKSQLDIPAVIRDIIGSEDIVPDRQAQSEIYTIAVF